MRRTLVAIVLAALAAAPFAGGGGHRATASPPRLFALAAPRAAPNAFVAHGPLSSPPCFRDSPGGRCVRVCFEFVAVTSACPQSKPRMTAIAGRPGP